MSVTAVLSRNRRVAAGLLAVFAAATLAACGSSDDSSGDTSNTGTNSNQQGGGGGNSAMTAYINCLKENGVTITMPSRGTGGNGAMPSGAPGGGNGGTPPSGAPGGGSGAMPSGAPGGGNGGGGGREITQPDGVDDATWTKATTACATLKPTARASAAATS
ncbi:hypothetical protein [Actinoplanes sp. NPDC026619]|uniref:hypothetical protein n=1 Tax=Actinoplanes sp. NPDC026619 TaxID=3155798 RepID=UPI0033EF8A50